MFLKWIFGVIVLLQIVVGQYVQHPFGAVSFSQNTFYQPHGYNYVAPSGQKVNVYFGSQLHHAPLANDYNQPLFRNNFPINKNYEISSRFETNDGWLLQSSQAPTDKSLFKPANVEDAAASNKQIEAYNDYIRDLWKKEQEENDSNKNIFEY